MKLALKIFFLNCEGIKKGNGKIIEEESDHKKEESMVPAGVEPMNLTHSTTWLLVAR